ncbi:MAG TPA: ABC transporter permease [Candidatus Acidoferrales bacterium]|nr:ABC transporter permease [Candidatus Acidoferrales bacterium]
MGNFANDVRYAFRFLRKSPSFMCIALATLALGIGANTSLFSIVNSVLLNPLPYPHPDQLVRIAETSPLSKRGGVTYMNFLDWQRSNSTFAAMAAYRSEEFDLVEATSTERVQTRMVSAEYFRVLGVPPAMGRSFTTAEDQPGAAPVAVISAGFWKRKFGAARDVLEKTLNINGEAYSIVGVLPENFTFLRNDELYVPIGQWDDPTFRNRGIRLGATAIGRLKDGVTLAQAQSDADGIALHLAELFPTTNKSRGVALYPLKADLVGNVSDFLYVLLGAVGFVLLIACANVANLLLARSLARSREFAIRTALGATRGRIVSQLLTESVLLGVAGGALGLLMASYSTKAVLSALPAALPRSAEIGMDWHVLLFTLAVSIFAGAFFGLTPALKIWRPDVYESLKKGGRGSSGGSHRAQGVFVAAEMGIALVLLVGAGLMIRSLAVLWSVDPGFNPRNLLTFSVALQPSLTTDPPGIRNRMHELEAKFAAIPGVQGVASQGTGLPLAGDNSTLPFWIEGRPKPATRSDMPQAVYYLVSPGYFDTLKVPLLRGRYFDAHDNADAPTVLVVDDKFAARFFPNEDAIGKTLNIDEIGMRGQIVGVTGHVKQFGLDTDATTKWQQEMYVPMEQIPVKLLPIIVRGVGFVVRTASAPQTYATPVREVVTQINREQVAYGFKTMDEIITRSLAARRFSMFLLGVFAGVALILSSIGIYGVVSYLVGQRMHELGIRVALGAQRADLLRLVIGQGLRMALLGVAIGTAAALGLTRLMTKLLFGVSAADPLTYFGVAAVLTAIAMAACYVPARRAMKVDPIIALRYE